MHNKIFLIIQWIKYSILHALFKVLHHFGDKNIHYKFHGQYFRNPQDISDMIGDMISSDKPFCLLRPGSVEYSGAHEWIEHELVGTNRYRRQNLYWHVSDSDEKKIKRWVDGFREDLGTADIFAYIGEPEFPVQFLTKCFCKKECKYMYYNYGTWNQNITDPWFDKLSGKRVLFISPFVESFEYQWKRYDKVCGGNKCLPYDMNPIFMKSVWYLKSGGDDFEDWFTSLEYLLQKERELDFDIALISCGPFSTFLAADIKRRGKQAVQYGGEMQILFGVLGNRYENSKAFDAYRNEFWIHPFKSEHVLGMEKWEDACYW